MDCEHAKMSQDEFNKKEKKKRNGIFFNENIKFN